MTSGELQSKQLEVTWGVAWLKLLQNYDFGRYFDNQNKSATNVAKWFSFCPWWLKIFALDKSVMSDWLAAYEAQKAKALKKIEEGSGGAASSGNARGALGGSTSYQGMVTTTNW